MKPVRILVVLAVAALASGSALRSPLRPPLQSLGGIAGSAHDFSAQGWNSSGEICRPCHTPHNASEDDGYLWNHDYAAAGRTYWDGAVDNEHSLLCLSCHDGQTALDSFGGMAGSTYMAGAANLGADLTDDHPIGVEYPVGSSRWGAVTTTSWGHTAVGGSLPLWGAGDVYIECTTCHTPHSAGSSGNFLRMENDASAMCLTCHLK